MRLYNRGVLPFIPVLHVQSLSAALAVLAAMITPALLISASGTLILSTSTRLGRVVDRARRIAERMEDLMAPSAPKLLLEKRRAMLTDQLARLRRRATKLQRCLTALYLAVSTFVLTSVFIGLVAIFEFPVYWLPVMFGVGGACFLLYGSLLLITEARLAVDSLKVEMDFLGYITREHAEHPDRMGAPADS